MVRIQVILVAVDFSPHAERALETAVELAKVFGAKVHLLHCYQINLGGISPYGLAIPETFDRDVRAAAQRKLDEWGEKVRAEGVEVESHVSSMFPGITIPATAQELGADLIVMGTRGLTGLKHILLGSVAERTIRVAACPVLTVKLAEGE
ncbi:MAG: universal stress protein [Myxococcales bacterium]|nr:universal stress protein [Myxococcales bacterium]